MSQRSVEIVQDLFHKEGTGEVILWWQVDYVSNCQVGKIGPNHPFFGAN
jgi:hypothetical protein